MRRLSAMDHYRPCGHQSTARSIRTSVIERLAHDIEASDPHHLRFAQPRALGRKASNEFAVPLCRIHHRLLHRVGNEGAWWQEVGIDPLNAARKLWKRTRLDRPRPDSANGPRSR